MKHQVILIWLKPVKSYFKVCVEIKITMSVALPTNFYKYMEFVLKIGYMDNKY